MARNYILGGMAGTQLQAGKPYFKRIVRIKGSGSADRNVVNTTLHPGSEGYTCEVTPNGEISFNLSSPDWNANSVGAGRFYGELLMVEFPTTMRNVEINLEESWVGGQGAEVAVLDENGDPVEENGIPVTQILARKQTAGQGQIRLKVMLTSEISNKFQKTHFFDADGNPDPNSPLAKPIRNGNYIEVMQGETATISSRTKVVFILIQKFASDDILDPVAGNFSVGAPGHDDDAVSILITGVLDHEPTSGGSQAANEPNSKVIEDGGVDTRTLRKIWGAADGIG